MGLTAKKVYAILNGKIKKLNENVSSLGTPLFYAGSVETSDLLPLSPKTGAVYNIEQKSIYGESGTNVAWNGTIWDALGPTFDLSLLLTKEEAEEQYIKKQQGIENVGKALVIGEDGTVIPKEIQEESGSSIKIDSTLTQPGQAADAQVTGREIASLHQNKADAIVETVAGEIVTVPDSSGAKLEGLRVMGKSTQVQTTGAQLFDPFEEEIVYNGVVITRNADASCITVHGTATNNGSISLSKPFKMRANTTYILNIDNPHMFENIWVQISNSDGSHVGDYLWMGKNSNTMFTNTLPDNITDQMNCKIMASLLTGKTYNFSINHLSLFEGSLKGWEPYTGRKPAPSPEYPQQIVSAGENGNIKVEVTGKNLLPILIGVVSNGLTCKCNEDGTITVTGTATNTWSNITYLNYKYPIKKGTYIFSVDQTFNFIIGIKHKRIENTDGQIIKRVNKENTEIKYDLTDESLNALSIFLENLKIGEIYNFTFRPMLRNAVVKDSSFELYHTPQFLPLATPNGLPGVPVVSGGNYTDAAGQQWICDERDYGRGKYVQRVEVVKANDLTWKADFFGEATNIVYRYSTSAILNLIDRLNGLSNCFRYKTGSTIKSNEFVVEEGGRLRVVFGNQLESIDALMEWFRQKETVFYLPRNSPIEYDLTPEELAAYEALHTNYPTTVITNDAGVHMEVSYVADTRNYIRNLEARLNAKLVNIQSALISQKISGGV